MGLKMHEVLDKIPQWHSDKYYEAVASLWLMSHHAVTHDVTLFHFKK